MPDHVISYVESDVPVDCTLVQWANARHEEQPRRRRRIGLRLRVPQLGQVRPAFA